MAFPQLSVQIVKNLETIYFTQLHFHLEQLLILSQLLNRFLSLLQFTIPFHFFIYGISSQMDCLSSCVYYQRYRIIHFTYYLCDFQVNSTFNLLFSWTKHQHLFMDTEVVLDPSWKEPLPHFEVTLHLNIVYIVIIIAIKSWVCAWEGQKKNNRNLLPNRKDLKLRKWIKLNSNSKKREIP